MDLPDPVSDTLDSLVIGAGQADNEGMSLDDALDGVRRVCGAVPDLPVTADMESGYGTPAAELVERMLEAGAVGSVPVPSAMRNSNAGSMQRVGSRPSIM